MKNPSGQFVTLVTLKDIVWLCALAEDACGSYSPEDCEDGRLEVRRIRFTLMDLLRSHEELKPALEERVPFTATLSPVPTTDGEQLRLLAAREEARREKERERTRRRRAATKKQAKKR